VGVTTAEEVGALDQDGALMARLLESISAAGASDLWPGARAHLNELTPSYAGPYHMAQLLLGAADALAQGAVAHTPAPPTVGPAEWRAYVRALAERRPYLWENHVEALGGGYLAPGTSAVVCYPTGAGKSTLSELKIAAALLAGRRVLFLVPTRALVTQTVAALRAAFPSRGVAESLVGDGAYHEADDGARPDVVVMTPERCLVYLGGDRAALADVGLLVFDECHLLHAGEGDGADRRSVDAMLCQLGVLDAVRGCDVLLLSAMVRNTAELARWVSAATERPCLELSGEWRPTRQARGCVVFDRDRVATLRTAVAQTKAGRRTAKPPVVLKRTTQATPFALFGLTHRWAAEVTPRTYSLLPLLGQDVPLRVNDAWALKADPADTAVRLAARMAASGVKTLVFLQSKQDCFSAAEELRALMVAHGTCPAAPLVLTPAERELLASAAEDLGGSQHVISSYGAAAAVHNALLLPAERRASESAFARADGVSVLLATPTVAQGMNLPAEAVILAGDKRFDQAVQGRTRLAAHELLNAAGRAGRAGHRAAGIVLVVPDEVVATTTPVARSVGGPWALLRENVFSLPDQCLDVVDPIELLLDRVQVWGDRSVEDPEIRYFLTRLPVDEREHDPTLVAARLLRRSLAAYRAGARDQVARFQTRLETALRLRRRITLLPDRVVRLDRIASASGMPPRRVQELDAALASSGLPEAASVDAWVLWLFGWLADDPMRLADTVRPKAIEAALAPAERTMWSRPGTTPANRTACLAAIKARVLLSMRGAPLARIERELAGRRGPDPRCRGARRFVTDALHELGYLAGLVTQVRRAQIDAQAETWFASDGTDGAVLSMMPPALASLAACVREGVDRPRSSRYCRSWARLPRGWDATVNTSR
jgi:hypothetical protein